MNPCTAHSWNRTALGSKTFKITLSWSFSWNVSIEYSASAKHSHFSPRRDHVQMRSRHGVCHNQLWNHYQTAFGFGKAGNTSLHLFFCVGSRVIVSCAIAQISLKGYCVWPVSCYVPRIGAVYPVHSKADMIQKWLTIVSMSYLNFEWTRHRMVTQLIASPMVDC